MGPAQDRPDTQEAQHVPGDVGVGDPLRRPVPGDRPGKRHRPGESLEPRRVGLVVLEIGPRDERAPDAGLGKPGPYERQLVRVLERQGAEQDGVGDAEDRHVAADAQRQREHDDAGEERPPGERAEAVPQVTKNVSKHGETSEAGGGR